MQATVYFKATKVMRQSGHGLTSRPRDGYGPGVTSRRLNLEVTEEQTRQLATVLAALRITPKRPPGWMRITVNDFVD